MNRILEQRLRDIDSALFDLAEEIYPESSVLNEEDTHWLEFYDNYSKIRKFFYDAKT